MKHHKQPINGNTLTLWACVTCFALAYLAYYLTVNY